MNLTKEEQAMLDGEQGPGMQKAIEIVVALGNIYGAKELVPVTSVQVAGVSYKNLGDAGIKFLNEWADKGGRIRVPTTLNPAGMDLDEWEKIGFEKEFAEKQLLVIKAFEKMGIPPSCSCTPYLTGNIPKYGDHIAWAESSAVSFSNSVLGARTNREGGPSAIAAAISGRTANYGYHLDDNRKPDYTIEVTCDIKTDADYGALGYLVGKAVKNKVPYYTGIKNPSLEQLKTLGASMAASGAVALYHMEGVTPEARNGIKPVGEKIIIDSLKEGYEALNATGTDNIDFVSIGCPHASINEIKSIANLVEGKTLKAKLWVCTAKQTKALAERMGLDKIIEGAGGFIVADTCMVVAPVESFGFKNLATNAGKGACYAPNHCKLNTHFGDLEKCIASAISGRWE